MAESTDLSELVRRTMEANARFYQGWMNLSLEYFKGISEALSGVQAAVPGASHRDAEDAPAPGAVVLEAEAGEDGGGAFLVTNDLGRTLKCELAASELAGPDGEPAPARVDFEPASFALEPGEQKVVRATTTVPDALTAGVPYSGTIGIKGMEGFSVPLVLRRTHAPRSPIDELDPDAGSGPEQAPKKPTAGKAKAKSSSKASKASKKTTAKKTTASRAGSKARSSSSKGRPKKK
jgi:hypothetical protein